MYLFLMLLSIVGMILLISVLITFAYQIMRDKKNPYAWTILTIIIFFLGLSIWQGLKFLNFAVHYSLF